MIRSIWILIKLKYALNAVHRLFGIQPKFWKNSLYQFYELQVRDRHLMCLANVLFFQKLKLAYPTMLALIINLYRF